MSTPNAIWTDMLGRLHQVEVVRTYASRRGGVVAQFIYAGETYYASDSQLKHYPGGVGLPNVTGFWKRKDDEET